jgi:LmbE family N-acetylglucosaminyl deacetylase
MRILACGAHPDDVEIFMFGTLAAARQAGAAIACLIATDGAHGGQAPPDQLRQLRRTEALAGASLLGIEPIFLDHPDGELASETQAAGGVAAAMERFAPDLVITHAPSDYHPDHRALSRLAADAARFRVPVLYADTLMGNGFLPTHYVDISRHFELKCAAIRAHATQRPERFVEACLTWNRFRALQCNAPKGYAEAFRFDPVYPFADIRALLPPPPAVTPL